MLAPCPSPCSWWPRSSSAARPAPRECRPGDDSIDALDLRRRPLRRLRVDRRQPERRGQRRRPQLLRARPAHGHHLTSAGRAAWRARPATDSPLARRSPPTGASSRSPRMSENFTGDDANGRHARRLRARSVDGHHPVRQPGERLDRRRRRRVIRRALDLRPTAASSPSSPPPATSATSPTTRIGTSSSATCSSTRRPSSSRRRDGRATTIAQPRRSPPTAASSRSSRSPATSRRRHRRRPRRLRARPAGGTTTLVSASSAGRRRRLLLGLDLGRRPLRRLRLGCREPRPRRRDGSPSIFVRDLERHDHDRRAAGSAAARSARRCPPTAASSPSSRRSTLPPPRPSRARTSSCTTGWRTRPRSWAGRAPTPASCRACSSPSCCRSPRTAGSSLSNRRRTA